MGAKLTSGVCLCALALLTLCSGCANNFKAPLKPATGILATSYTIPLTLPSETIQVKNLKKVSETASYFFWPYPTFDVAWTEHNQVLGRIASRGSLSTCEYADVEVVTFFGLFGSYTVNVYGVPAR